MTCEFQVSKGPLNDPIPPRPPFYRYVTKGIRKAIRDGRVLPNLVGLVSGPIMHRIAGVSYGDMVQSAQGRLLASNPLDLLTTLLGHSPPDIDVYTAEYLAFVESLARRQNRTESRYPAVFAMDNDVALFLYVYCRLMQPRIVIETGVADGRSTSTILQAMAMNGSGKLHSIDVRPDVGALVSEEQRCNWTLHVLTAPRRSVLASTIRSIPPGDLFLHDSNHTYLWQRAEFGLAMQWVKPGGVIMVDDADASYAWLDICRTIDLSPHVCLAGQRLFSAVTVPARGQRVAKQVRS